MKYHTHMLRYIFAMLVIFVPAYSYAAPDQYPGDISIYGGTATTTIQPNILIILDNSGSMSSTIVTAQVPYDPNTTYPSLRMCNGAYCSANKVYKASDYSLYINDVNFVSTNCNGDNPQSVLKTTGQYNGSKLSTSGACRTGTGSYVLGNYINWLKGASTSTNSKLNIAKAVVSDLIKSTTGVGFGLMKFNTDEGGTFVSQSVSGVNYVTTIKNMADIHTGTTTNRDALLSVVNSYTASTWTPLAETLYEALLYYKGATKKFGFYGFDASNKYTSPIKASCQRNYIIIVTDGMSTQDQNAILGSAIGDFDGDHADPGSFDSYGSHYLDDVAKYLYDKDLLTDDSSKPETLGMQRVTTFTIGFGLTGADADAVNLLNRAADSNHGHGQAFLAADQTGLSEALTQVISNILETNSSFVAPVVPVSPENKTASASRMYIGLFKPNAIGAWEGNLKKFGLDKNNYLIDQNGVFANYVDLINNTTKTLGADGFDDRDNTSLPNGKVNGSFRDTSRSFWSETIDKADVNAGGAGALLQAQDPSTRVIFTYLGNTDLYDASNSFVTSNASLTPALLGVADTTAKDALVQYIRGVDAYDDNGNGSKTDNRDWIMGDVLHSKPTVVNYEKYTFNTTNEADCAVNKTVIYVGSNDGQLHAIRDCDGSEIWSFIPPDQIPNLQYTHSTTHTNFVDSTVTTYVYDDPSNNPSGSPNELFIDPTSTSDKVLLLFGQRRGGGANIVPAKGYYYLIDATNPERPKYISRISNATTGFSEMAETWSEPKLEKIKVGNQYKIAAIFGGGYDNLNEDSRYGLNQQYLGTGGVVNTDVGAGYTTSSGSSVANTPRGRGIYVVEIATIGSPMNFTNLGSLIWSYTNTTNPTDMKYSIAGEIATIDTRGRGYVDRLYAADSAGNLWRFNIGAYYNSSVVNESWSNSDPANWKGLKVFTPNPGSQGTTDVGRKSFYKPAVLLDYCYDSAASTMVNCDMVFYGTGDREHPMNKNVTDRMYMVKVRDKDVSVKTECATTATILGNCLLDVTTDQLQTTEVVNISTDPNNPTVGSVPYILKQLKESGGWYIKLNENDGEKVLASPRVIDKVAYFTTYVPTNSDPCQIANPGDSFIYILNYLTGEAAFNLDRTNDAVSAAARTTTNIRQAKNSNTVVVRSDRKGMIGQGIASGVVSSTSSTGVTKLFLSSGGNIVPIVSGKGQSAKILYWRQK